MAGMAGKARRRAEIAAGGGGRGEVDWRSRLSRVQAELRAADEMLERLRQSLPEPGAAGATSPIELLEHAPDELASLAAWLFMLPAESLREVWVAAVMQACDLAGVPPGVLSGLGRALLTVRARLAPSASDGASTADARLIAWAPPARGASAGAAGAGGGGGRGGGGGATGHRGGVPGRRGGRPRRGADWTERTVAAARALAKVSGWPVRLRDVGGSTCMHKKIRPATLQLLAAAGFTVRPATVEEHATRFRTQGRPPTVIEPAAMRPAREERPCG